MKLLLGAKRYLEECELKKKKEMEPEIVEEHDDDFVIPDQKTLEMKLLMSLAFHPLDCAKHLMVVSECFDQLVFLK